MIKIEMTENGIMMEANGDGGRLLTEFSAIIEQFNKRGLLDKNMYEVCWKLATSTSEEKIDFMREELKKHENKANKELDEVLEQLKVLLNEIKED